MENPSPQIIYQNRRPCVPPRGLIDGQHLDETAMDSVGEQYLDYFLSISTSYS